jgi:hypothetical protein
VAATFLVCLIIKKTKHTFPSLAATEKKFAVKILLFLRWILLLLRLASLPGLVIITDYRLTPTGRVFTTYTSTCPSLSITWRLSFVDTVSYYVDHDRDAKHLLPCMHDQTK